MVDVALLEPETVLDVDGNVRGTLEVNFELCCVIELRWSDVKWQRHRLVMGLQGSAKAGVGRGIVRRCGR